MYYVQDIMISNVITIGEAATVSQAAKLMTLHSIGSLVVVPEGVAHKSRLHISQVGLITERDILNRVVAHDRPTNLRVSEVCTKSPPHIDACCSVSDAFELMTRHHIRWLIVSKEWHVVGIVTLTDLTKAVRFSSASRLLGLHERDHFRLA